MRGLRWIRLDGVALVLLVAAPSAEPQGTIATFATPRGATHSFNFSEVRQINPSPYLNPHAPPPQRPGVTP